MWSRPDSQEVGLEAAILERVRNSSLVEWFRADNSPGPKSSPEGVGDGQTVYIPLPLADDKVRVQDALGQAGRGDGVAASNRAGHLRVTEAGGSLRATKDDPVDPWRQEKPHTGSRERPYRK